MPTFKPLAFALVAAASLLVASIAYRSLSSEPATLDAASASSSGAHRVNGSASFDANGATTRADAAFAIRDASGLTLDAARLFELGFAGGLVIDKDTRAVIEAVLNSMPERPSEQDLQRLERTLREGLPREDAEKAMQLFSSYRDYTADVRQQMEPAGIPRNLQEMNAFFDQVESLKRRHFDEATSNALFGHHDAHARVTMEAMFVEQDSSLTLERKKERLDALRAKLPADQQSLIPQPASAGASQVSS